MVDVEKELKKFLALKDQYKSVMFILNALDSPVHGPVTRELWARHRHKLGSVHVEIDHPDTLAWLMDEIVEAAEAGLSIHITWWVTDQPWIDYALDDEAPFIASVVKLEMVEAFEDAFLSKWGLQTTHHLQRIFEGAEVVNEFFSE